MMDTQVVVIGGGIMGMATAWRLSVAGVDAILLEQHAAGHDRGSSHGATRIFRYAYDDPMYVRLAMRALALWEEAGDDLLARTGGIDLAPEAMLDGTADALHRCGARAERLDLAARAERWPWLRAAPDAPALYSPDTAVIRAARALDRFASLARTGGTDLRQSCRVNSIDAGEDDVRIRTDDGDIRARRAVLAAGAWTGPLAATVGLDLPLRVTREQVHFLAGGDDLLPFIDRTAAFRYGVPAAGVAPGYKVAEHVAGDTTTADTRGFTIDVAAEERILTYAAEALPSLRADPVAAETCLYTLTPDEDFIIETTGPIVVASPCSGHGFKFAPLIGEILASLALDRDPPVDIARFRWPRLA